MKPGGEAPDLVEGRFVGGAKVYGGEGIAQLLFFEGDDESEVAYADRKGKYMRQQGVTLPKM